MKPAGGRLPHSRPSSVLGVTRTVGAIPVSISISKEGLKARPQHEPISDESCVLRTFLCCKSPTVTSVGSYTGFVRPALLLQSQDVQDAVVPACRSGHMQGDKTLARHDIIYQAAGIPRLTAVKKSETLNHALVLSFLRHRREARFCHERAEWRKRKEDAE